MKNAEIKALSLDELRERLNTEVQNKQNLRFAHSISPLENPGRITQNRKLVARLNTELSNREREARINTK